MIFSASLWRSALVLLAGLALSGCLPSTQSQLDEEKETHFLAGKSRVNAMDYPGAIEAFEKALEINPQSASAHFELALLYDQKESDPAAAIYHYERYLKLQPNAGNADTVKPRILACKQELARTVSLGPVTQTLQREFERLTEENKRLREEVEKWRTYYANRPPTPTNPPQLPPPAPPPVPQTNLGSGQQVGTMAPGGPATPEHGGAAPGSSRIHTVKAGETLNSIARQYGLKVEALLAANPKLNPRRLRVGQAVSLPAP